MALGTGSGNTNWKNMMIKPNIDKPIQPFIGSLYHRGKGYATKCKENQLDQNLTICKEKFYNLI